MADYEEIIYEVDGPVATITLNRPDTLNALTDRTQAEVRHALEDSESNGDIIVNVLTGAGRGFCSGVDMNALGKMSEAGKRVGKSHDELAADPEAHLVWSAATTPRHQIVLDARRSEE